MTPFITDLNMHLTKSKAEDENPVGVVVLVAASC